MLSVPKHSRCSKCTDSVCKKLLSNLHRILTQLLRCSMYNFSQHLYLFSGFCVVKSWEKYRIIEFWVTIEGNGRSQVSARRATNTSINEKMRVLALIQAIPKAEEDGCGKFRWGELPGDSNPYWCGRMTESYMQTLAALILPSGSVLTPCFSGWTLVLVSCWDLLSRAFSCSADCSEGMWEVGRVTELVCLSGMVLLWWECWLYIKNEERSLSCPGHFGTQWGHQAVTNRGKLGATSPLGRAARPSLGAKETVPHQVSGLEILLLDREGDLWAQSLTDGNDQAKLELSQVILNCTHKITAPFPTPWIICSSLGTKKNGLLPGCKPCLSRSFGPECLGQCLIGKAFTMYSRTSLLQRRIVVSSWCKNDAQNPSLGKKDFLFYIKAW